ncbi:MULTISPECIES: hypothetical protein [unclassified Clostridium]|uniref:hypothetical protein n=1 Tax=unclassified Clostridium TaxID=2614128 RepID=UPI0020792515|nr:MULTISPECIES: hypothetical protein [unclassified Clostridium]
MIRKGLVFILTNKIEDTYNYITDKIPHEDITEIKSMYKQREFKINNYRIVIIDDSAYISRGHKPEFSYIIGNIKTPKLSDNFDLLSYISNMSTRKEKIRKIDSLEQLDVKEFIDDKYAEENYCDKNKLIWWSAIFDPSPIDKHKWEREYNCTWIGEKD